MGDDPLERTVAPGPVKIPILPCLQTVLDFAPKYDKLLSNLCLTWFSSVYPHYQDVFLTAIRGEQHI